MVQIEIETGTHATMKYNGMAKILVPGDKMIVRPRNGELVKIWIDERDIFREDREKFTITQEKLKL